MNQICFINGSPRGKNSASKGLIGKVSEMLDLQRVEIHELCVVESMQQNKQEQDFALLNKMNSIVFVFPLYIDAIPSNLLEYMYEFDEYLSTHDHTSGNTAPTIYAMVNNGFLEGSQNTNALQIMAHYTNRIGCNWGFGIGIGAGEFIKETLEVIPMKSRLKRNIHKALVELVTELESPNTVNTIQLNDIMTNPSMPKLLFMAVGNRHWTSEAKTSKKSLSKKVWTEA